MRVAVPRAWVRARRTILSADTVSFLAAAILYYFAAGDVKGFAFTLGLSTILDLVVVFLFTHPIVSLLSRSRGLRLGPLHRPGRGARRRRRRRDEPRPPRRERPPPRRREPVGPGCRALAGRRCSTSTHGPIARRRRDELGAAVTTERRRRRHRRGRRRADPRSSTGEPATRPPTGAARRAGARQPDAAPRAGRCGTTESGRPTRREELMALVHRAALYRGETQDRLHRHRASAGTSRRWS